MAKTAQKRVHLSKEDWLDVERMYRAGQIKMVDVAKYYEISSAAISMRAKKYGWSRDLTKRVRRQVEHDLIAGVKPTRYRDKEMEDREIIKKAAKTGVEIVRQHREQLSRGHNLIGRMLAELENTTTHLKEITEWVNVEENDKKRQRLLNQALSIRMRASVMRDLSAAISRFQPLERKAFNLDERSGEIDEFDAFIQGVRACPESNASHVAAMRVQDAEDALDGVSEESEPVEPQWGEADDVQEPTDQLSE